MNWLQLLAFLACPLMMIICMRGMFSGKNEKKNRASESQDHSLQFEVQQLKLKMADLMEQNHQMNKEIEGLKSK